MCGRYVAVHSPQQLAQEFDIERVAVEGVEPDLGTFDAALRRANVEYDGRRESGRMGPPEASVVRPGTFAAWREARVRAGAPDAQVKDPIVLDPEKWDALVGGRGAA